MQRAGAWAAVSERVSERYPSVCVDFHTHTFDERLREIAAAAPPGSVPVGYSMGGRLALHAALRSPGRFAALGMLGASAGIADPAARQERRRSDDELAAWIEQQPIERVVERWENQPVFAGQPPELVSAQRAGRLSHEPSELASLLRTAGQGACPPVWDLLPELDCPLLALAGEQDDHYAEAARRLAELVPEGRCALVAGAGHAPQLEVPETTARLLLEFLDEHLG